MYQNQVPEFSKKFPDLQGFGPTNVGTGMLPVPWLRLDGFCPLKWERKKEERKRGNSMQNISDLRRKIVF